MSTTVIRNADWVIAWDEAAGRHTYRRNIDVAFADERITFVGRDYGGAGGPGDRRQGSAGVAGADRHPFASRARAALSRGARGARRAQYAHDRALRALAGVCGAR